MPHHHKSDSSPPSTSPPSSESSARSKQIYITLTSDHPEIFQTIQKNAPYINHLMESQTESQFYLEVIEKGLLYIYNDFAIFKLLNQPFTPRQVLHYIKRSKLIEELDHIFPYYLRKEKFPKEGIRIFFHTDSDPKDEIIRLGHKHFTSLLGDKAVIITISSGDLEIRFKTFDQFSLYLTLMASMLTGIFRKIPTLRKSKEKSAENSPSLIQ